MENTENKHEMNDQELEHVHGGADTGYVCQVCGAKFSATTLLKIHMEDKHNNQKTKQGCF